MPDSTQNVLSIFKPEVKIIEKKNNYQYVAVKLDLGKFSRCGYYDWRIVKLGKDGKIMPFYKITEKMK